MALVERLLADETAALDVKHRGSLAYRDGGEAPAAGRGQLVVAVLAAAPDLRPSRRGRARLGHRRQRVRRLPQRLRRHGDGPRAPEDRGGGARTRRVGDALRAADRGRADRGRPARRAVRAAVLAVRQLGDRVDAGRHAHHARAHRSQADPEDRGDVSRPPRLADGVGVPAGGQGRPARPSRIGAADARAARGVRRPGGRGAVQRRGRGRARVRGAPGADRRHDRRARHDELRPGAARPGLPPGA